MNHAVTRLREERRCLLAQLEEVRHTEYFGLRHSMRLEDALHRNLRDITEALEVLAKARSNSAMIWPSGRPRLQLRAPDE